MNAVLHEAQALIRFKLILRQGATGEADARACVFREPHSCNPRGKVSVGRRPFPCAAFLQEIDHYQGFGWIDLTDYN